jgi:class 3 adenylate cyclase
MPVLRASERAKLPSRAFAYIDSTGRKRLPIHDESHVRNALARFDQVVFGSDEDRERARERLLRAAKKYGIVPVGFVHGQLRKERTLAGAAATLPKGIVTFLMTDIEGSTRLLQALGHRYAPLLRSIRSTIRTCVRRRGGHEVDARADEYFAAFTDPDAALGAAIDIQRDLANRRWTAGARVRVRIGLHRGRTTLSEAGYVGITVHTTARICQTGRGGDIVVSTAMRQALGSPPDVRLKSLGPVRLDGLPKPEVLHRVVL